MICHCANPACRINGCSIANGYKAQEMPIDVRTITLLDNDRKPHKCPLCDGKGQQLIENPYAKNEYCSGCINLYLDKIKDSFFWNIEDAINKLTDCENCKEIVKNTKLNKPCIACKGACVLWG